ncbi:PilZ domain-containing protein [Bacillus sp. ISL-34]|uniref:PilZ domain-containing protein n=1 Tax=Bacillus sp. ISL-34 TaxID=2819121 RepID=UPI001BEC9E98|nr:PilZ domain-containing protein [Bacillus sp. ISL-34]MBT2649237.1 PilZ domain-containing protein [Bacillus sp. ISL-34]
MESHDANFTARSRNVCENPKEAIRAPGCNPGYSRSSRTFRVSPFRALTEDISAGGASIRLLKGTNIQSVSQLYLWMALTLKSGEIHYLRLKSKVIRVTEKDHGNMLLHVQFLEPTKNDVQTLMRFIFEKQVDLKKKACMLNMIE